jgi:tetratricopeptide (TPR) repeat protein
MRYLLSTILVCCAILTACSEEQPGSRTGQTLIQFDPLSEVKAEIAKDPKNADAWYHLADLYERTSMYPEEVEALLKVISLDPSRGFAYEKLGTAYNRLGRYDDAIAQFRKATKYLPTNPVLYNNMAFAYGKTGKIDEQVSALKQAIAIRPSYATAHYNLGVVYLHKKDKDQALRQYAKLKNIDETMAASLKKEIDAGSRR